MPSEQVWKVANALRDSGNLLTLANLIEACQARGLRLTFDESLDLVPLLNSHGEWTTPRSLLMFLGQLVASIEPTTILDPFARHGDLLISSVRAAAGSHGVGLVRNSEQSKVCTYLGNSDSIKWILGAPLSELSQLPSDFDLVLSCTPWGASPRESATLNGVTLHDYAGEIIAAHALTHLKAGGTAILVLNSAFIAQDREGVFAHLPKLGFSTDALIHFPPRYFAQAEVDGYVVILRRQPEQGPIFTGELSLSDEHNEELAKNLIARRSTSEVSLGYLHEGEYPGYRQLSASLEIQALAKRMRLSPKRIKDLARSVNLTKKDDPEGFPDTDNAVFLPLLGSSDAVTSKDAMTIRAHNYAQIVLDDEHCSAEFMACYFNSAIGFLTRQIIQSGTFIPKITKSSILAGEVFVPPLDDQLRCVEIESKARMLSAEVSGVREELWRSPLNHRSALESLNRINREDTFDAWLDTLPFPLASILWAYHAAGDDDKARYEHLLHFFEALAEFLALVLWSATKTEPALFTDPRYPLTRDKPVNYPLERSSFGAWVEIGGRLSKYIRTLLNEKKSEQQEILSAFGMTVDRAVLHMLSNSETINCLQQANKVRNTAHGHGGIVGREDARRRRVALESILASVRGVFGTKWTDFPLYRAGAARIRGGIKYYDAERVMGRVTPFVQVTVESIREINDGYLFLCATGSNKPVELAPLVVIAPSPHSAQNACYFYNRVEKEGLRFVSYHFENDAEIMEDSSAGRDALQELLRATSSA